MLTKQVSKAKKLLQKTKNPLFFFDDDIDGLASFLLLRRYLGRGKGVAIKSSPVLDTSFVRKVKEYLPDKLIILDKPDVSQEFVHESSVPIIWIDHHMPVKREGPIEYFNPRLEDNDVYLPTSYFCYLVTKKDLWIAMAGIIGDWYIPEFTDEFCKQYPDLLQNPKDPGDVLYHSTFGKIIKIMAFLLKGKTSAVNQHISILTRVETPYEILNQTTSQAKFLYKRFEKVNKQYKTILEKAMAFKSKGKVLLFICPEYNMSFTGDLANELSYNMPDKIIVVGRKKGDYIRLSLRSKKQKINQVLKKALEDIDGHGGGHEYACGANVHRNEINIFIEKFSKLLK